MFDVITFGSAAWDVSARPKDFKILEKKEFIRNKALCFALGSKIDLEEIHFSSGGGGTNAAATFSCQGFKTAYCGTIGDDLAGQKIIKELKKLGIDCRFVFKTSLKPTNYSIIFNTGTEKERTVLAYRGASEELSSEEIPWAELKAKWFYLAPFSGKLAKLTEKIVDFGYRNNIKIAFNPGNSQLGLSKEILKRILKKVDILFLNREEASLLTKIAYQKEKKIFQKLDELCPGIAIMGSRKGMIVSNGKNLYQAKASKIKIIDRTGAGDAFASGFVSGLIKKGSIEHAIQLGMANSSSCMRKWGAKQGLLKKGEKFKKVKIFHR